MKYPFITRRDVIARLSRDPAFVRACMRLMHERFLQRETLEPPAGWMSSHRKLGEDLHVRVAAIDCSDADITRAANLAKRYAKQLARVLREEQIAQDPRLGLAAAVFGVSSSRDVNDTHGPHIDPEEDGGISVATDSAVAHERRQSEVHPKRRRGRPPGSKNKPKNATPTRASKRRRR